MKNTYSQLLCSTRNLIGIFLIGVLLIVGVVEASNLKETANSAVNASNLGLSGGTDAHENDNPFQVALLRKDRESLYEGHYCGGVLFSENIVLTAASCSVQFARSEVQVLSGTRSLDGGGDISNVERIIIHPDYDGLNGIEYDIAIWFIDQSIEDIPLPHLTMSDGRAGRELLFTGWGNVSTEDYVYPEDLQKMSLPLLSYSDCAAAYEKEISITENMLCAGLIASNQGICEGDVGGPITSGKNNMTLNGIASHATYCSDLNRVGIYTRLSATSIRDFVLENTRKLK